MSIANHDVDSILNQLFRNGLGVNNRDSIFTTDENTSNRRPDDVHRNRNHRNNSGIESFIMLLSELYGQGASVSSRLRTTNSEGDRRSQGEFETNSSGSEATFRVSSEGGFQPPLPNAQRTSPPNTGTSNRHFSEPVDNTPSPRTVTYPEFDEMIYLYHRNILEYNYTIQQMIDSIATTRTRTRNAGITEIYETGLQFNRNIQEYNKIMDNSLDLYRDMHFNRNSHDRNNYSVPSPRNPETPVIPVTTNTLPVISRPQSMVSYTIFPFIPSVTTETDDILLSEIQIHDFTESFIYNSLDNSNISTTVCPISLESFQEGDPILKIRHCGHEFKSVSLRQWFRRSSRCPLCRCNLLTPSTNRTSRSPSVAFSDISMNVSNRETEIVNTDAVNTDAVNTQNQVILPDSMISNNTNSNILRELYTTLLNTTDDLDQSGFNNVFQNILMESTDAPPNISNNGVDNIPNIRPLILSLLQNSLSSPIESIDITYTVDYDISNN